MIHHTVTKGTSATVRICFDGHSRLPGPLCHGVIAKSGVVHLVGDGRANHAGSGDDDVLRAVISEDETLPADNEANTDGNSHFYGFECENLGDGVDPWPAIQLEAIERVSAALCRHHGWSERSVIGHLEWRPGKVDPRGFTMASMRNRVRTRLGSKPAPDTEPKYQPFPGAAWFKNRPRSPIVTAMGKRLVAVGCSAYAEGPGPQWTDADRESYAKWQRKMGYTGADADGWPGSKSWEALEVPFVSEA
jgi:hypothetical protein